MFGVERRLCVRLSRSVRAPGASIYLGFSTTSALGTIQVIHSPDAHTWLPQAATRCASLPVWASPPVPRHVGPCIEVTAPVLRSHDDLAGPGGGASSRMPQVRKMMGIHAYQPDVGASHSRLLHVAHVALSGLGPALRP